MIAFEIGHLDLVKTLVSITVIRYNVVVLYKGILSTVFILSLILSKHTHHHMVTQIQKAMYMYPLLTYLYHYKTLRYICSSSHSALLKV